MKQNKDRLFTEGDLSNIASVCPGIVSEKVKSISKDQLLATPEEDLVKHIVTSLWIEPVAVYLDEQGMKRGREAVPKCWHEVCGS